MGLKKTYVCLYDMPRTQMTHILEDLTHKMEATRQKIGQLGSGCIYILEKGNSLYYSQASLFSAC